MHWFAMAALAGLMALNALASFKVIAGAEAGSRRILQLALVWLVPVIGAVVCLAFLATDTLHGQADLDRTAFVAGADASGSPAGEVPGVGICGCSGSVDGGDGGGD